MYSKLDFLLDGWDYSILVAHNGKVNSIIDYPCPINKDQVPFPRDLLDFSRFLFSAPVLEMGDDTQRKVGFMLVLNEYIDLSDSEKDESGLKPEATVALMYNFNDYIMCVFESEYILQDDVDNICLLISDAVKDTPYNVVVRFRAQIGNCPDDSRFYSCFTVSFYK